MPDGHPFRYCFLRPGAAKQIIIQRQHPPSLVFWLRTGGRRIIFSSNRQSIYLRSLQREGGRVGMASEVLPASDEAAVPKQSWHLSPGSGPRHVLTS
ncbi:unnamed protein product [Ectocarpus sp. CCAP 1310/34]|nr:unnamed protein product [Ectocarpus sp. CCAP 1310/34]